LLFRARTQRGVGENFPHAFGVTVLDTLCQVRQRGEAPMGSEPLNSKDASDAFKSREAHFTPLFYSKVMVELRSSKLNKFLRSHTVVFTV